LLTLSALFGSATLANSGRTKALSALIASSSEASSTHHGVQPRLSRDSKTKTPLGANSVADSTSLLLTAPGAKDLCREARDKALSAKDHCRKARDKLVLGANSEAILASLKRKALHNKAKFASKDRTKIVASSCEAILASPIAKRKPSRLRQGLFSPRGLTFSLLESL